MVLGNQLGVDMKTRQEMIYDFMLALTSNPAIYAYWLAHDPDSYHYNDFTYDLAKDLANTYLEGEY
jgi:hypothetical protein